LAVADGRAIVPIINKLLALPFIRKLATKDHHPPDHISFASNHGPSAKPFETFTTIINPGNPEESYKSRLWPVHCVVGTPGNKLLPELDLDKIDKIILKGIDSRVEMYSAFRSPLRNPPLPTAVSELADELRNSNITDVFIAGIAGEYCVKDTALDSIGHGWSTFVVEDAVRSVAGEEGWKETRRELESNGIRVVDLEWVEKVI
jgi:nicotinamidase-related amidase